MKACMRTSKPWYMAMTLGAAFGTLGLPGCGVSSASPNTPLVSGRVTYQGKPVTSGSIIFMPTDRNWHAGEGGKSIPMAPSWSKPTRRASSWRKGGIPSF